MWIFWRIAKRRGRLYLRTYASITYRRWEKEREMKGGKEFDVSRDMKWIEAQKDYQTYSWIITRIFSDAALYYIALQLNKFNHQGRHFDLIQVFAPLFLLLENCITLLSFLFLIVYNCTFSFLLYFHAPPKLILFTWSNINNFSFIIPSFQLTCMESPKTVTVSEKHSLHLFFISFFPSSLHNQS